MSNSVNTVQWWEKTTTALQLIEERLLGVLLLFLIFLSCTRILTRGFDTGGLLWADPLLRYLVLWSGFLGAAMATSRGKHITIDILGYLLPSRLKRWVTALSHLFSTCVAALLTWASLLFIISEKEFGPAGLMGVPSYIWNLIFPLSFFLITIRYGYRAIHTIYAIIANKSLPESTRP